jgi:hypothetical protein
MPFYCQIYESCLNADTDQEGVHQPSSGYVRHAIRQAYHAVDTTLGGVH